MPTSVSPSTTGTLSSYCLPLFIVIPKNVCKSQAPSTKFQIVGHCPTTPQALKGLNLMLEIWDFSTSSIAIYCRNDYNIACVYLKVSIPTRGEKLEGDGPVKVTMVIPSYWARESGVGWKEGDAIYDHPTPLDSEGTLLRAIQSIKKLEDKDFQLVIIAVATSEDIETQVEKTVANIIKSSNPGVDVLLFGHTHLKQIHELISKSKKEYNDLLQLRGYSNIRNLCMFIPHVLGSEVAVLIDDDEVFEDPEFMSKAKEFIGKNIGGRTVNAVAGYYLQPDGDYHVKKPFRPWMKYWDQYDRMNEAFDRIIGREPRLKETHFVFGGNMVIHRNLFTLVPFDPGVRRGEDIDFLINARMFGFHFFLDNQLSIKHLPPPNTHPTWMQLREDIYRFIYERAKIEHQKEIKGMTKVYPEDFDSYPEHPSK